MIRTIEQLRSAGARGPICVAVHGVFAADAYEKLLEAGAARIVTTNTIAHSSNSLDVSTAIADGIKEFFA